MADLISRSHSVAQETRSHHGSDHANGGAEYGLESEAHDDIDELVDTVRAGPTQEAMWANEEDPEPEQEPEPEPEPAPTSKVDVAPTWDGRW